MSRRSHLILVLFIALAILHTWPLAASPARYWLDTGDYKLNTWALGWIAHQLPRDPARLFHANIFHPEPWTLAFSEHLLPQAVFAMPVIWLGGPPHLGYNISLLAGFALTGWATAIVIGRWTGSVWAGVLAGCIAAFNARSMTAFAHLQSLHAMYLPLALLALDRLIVAARLRDAFATGVLLALQALTSSYWVVYTAIAATLGTLVRLPEWWPWGRKADARHATPVRARPDGSGGDWRGGRPARQHRGVTRTDSLGRVPGGLPRVPRARGDPDAVIVEVPFPVPRFRALNSVYLPAATVHWKPMVNGYSGLLPGSYVRLWRAGMDRFPLEPAAQALRAVGVTHAVVHRDRLSRRSRDRIIRTIERSGEFELLVRDGEVRLYRLVPDGDSKRSPGTAIEGK